MDEALHFYMDKWKINWYHLTFYVTCFYDHLIIVHVIEPDCVYCLFRNTIETKQNNMHVFIAISIAISTI